MSGQRNSETEAVLLANKVRERFGLVRAIRILEMAFLKLRIELLTENKKDKSDDERR